MISLFRLAKTRRCAGRLAVPSAKNPDTAGHLSRADAVPVPTGANTSIRRPLSFQSVSLFSISNAHHFINGLALDFKYTPCAVGETCSNRKNCPFKHLSTQPAETPKNGVAYFPIKVQGLAPLEEESSSVEESTTEFATPATTPMGPGLLNTAWQFPTAVTTASTVNGNNNNISENRKGTGRRTRHRRFITLDERKVSCAPLVQGEVRGHARRRSIVCTTGEVWVHDFPASQMRQRNSFDDNMVSGPLVRFYLPS
jgi:hypothetical protein